MNKRIVWILSIVGCLALTLAGYAQKGGKGGGEKTVLKATFRDAAATMTAGPDRIASDCRIGNLDPNACPYVDGQPGVSVGFSVNTNFRFEVVEEGARNFYLNFTDCVQAPCPPDQPEFLPPGVVEAMVGTELGFRAQLFVVGLGNLAVNQNAALNADLLFSKIMDRDGVERVWWVTYRNNAPEVCPAGSSAPLVGRRLDANTWEVEATTGNLGCLHSLVPKPGDGSEKFHGAYSMPFKLTITKQP